MSVDPNIPVCRLALLTDFTPEFFARELRTAASEVALPLEVLPVSPNAWEAQVLDCGSELYAFKPDFVLIGCSGPMQWKAFASGARHPEFASTLAARLAGIWDTLAGNLPNIEILQANMGPFPDGLPCGESGAEATSFRWQLASFNNRIVEEMGTRSHVVHLDWNDRIHQWGTDRAYDHRLWHTAAHPFSMEFVGDLVKPVLRRLLWRCGRFFKVLVLDLDETLWGGIVGEAGPGGIQIGQEGIGNIYRNFQLWARSVKDSGVLLAVASHNEETIARSAFSNTEQILSLEDFAAFRANWEPKSHMIREISVELNIGLDAFCFLDNSAFERNEVRTSLPEVYVPELPKDPAEWIPFLAGEALFETGRMCRDPIDRTRLIREERQRKVAQPAYQSYDAYLESLDMCGRIENLNAENLPRAHELVMRTNQFNLRTERHSRTALEAMLESDDWLGYLTGLRDRFGDYGLIGLLLIHRTPDHPTSAFIDTWVMSCRVFERGMELWTFNMLVQRLREAGFSDLTGEYRPTQKNAKFKDLLEKLGFQPTGKRRWRLDLSEVNLHQTHIDIR